MITLFPKDMTDFSGNGRYTLFPTTAKTYSVINGEWSASLSHPIDPEGVWRQILPDAVVKMPSHNGDQLYRIRRVERSASGVDAEMNPIFYDSAGDCFLIDVRPTGKTGQQALDAMTLANPKYSGESDIETAETAYYQYKNLMEAISGNSENSFLKRWGGEIEYDNFTVRILSRLGADRGYSIEDGKNILEGGLKETIDVTDVITRIYPLAYNGRKMSGNGYVDSSNAAQYPVIRGTVIEYPNVVLNIDAGSADWDDPTIWKAGTQNDIDFFLRISTSADFYKERKCYTRYSYDIDFADIRAMQDIDADRIPELHLGDTVTIRSKTLGIATISRVMSIEYDSANDRIEKISVADVVKPPDYFGQMNRTVASVNGALNADGSAKAAQMTGAFTQYVNMKAVLTNPTDGVEVSRLGDLVTVTFSSFPLQQSGPAVVQSWTLPYGYCPQTIQTMYLPTSSGNATVIMSRDGTVRITAPNTGLNYYAGSITYRTNQPMPEL